MSLAKIWSRSGLRIVGVPAVDQGNLLFFDKRAVGVGVSAVEGAVNRFILGHNQVEERFPRLGTLKIGFDQLLLRGGAASSKAAPAA